MGLVAPRNRVVIRLWRFVEGGFSQVVEKESSCPLPEQSDSHNSWVRFRGAGLSTAGSNRTKS